MKQAFLLLLCAIAAQAVVYRHQYHHTSCPESAKQDCPDGYTFSYEHCGCFKDGETPPKVPKHPYPYPYPHHYPYGPYRPPIVPLPGQVGLVPGPGSLNILPGAPSSSIFLPGPSNTLVTLPGASQCRVIIQCSAGQVFDERQCRCVCYTTYQCTSPRQLNQQSCQCECPYQYNCPGNTVLHHSSCRCECPVPLICGPNQKPNNLLCQCEPSGPNCIPRPCPHPYHIFNTDTCRCECQQSHAAFCTGNKVFDPIQCKCVCPNAGQVCGNNKYINPDTCECECRQTTTCNQYQTFDFTNCVCKCLVVRARVTIEIPGPPGLPQPGPDILVPGREFSRTPGGRIRTRGTRRRGRSVAEEIEGPEIDEAILVREKRRRSRSRRPGTRFDTLFVPGPLIPGTQGPPTVITEDRILQSCPIGTIQDDSCRCF